MSNQERTPGVGREEEEEGTKEKSEREEKSCDDGGESISVEEKSAVAEETRKKMVELETRIEKACSEENFDFAGVYHLLSVAV